MAQASPFYQLKAKTLQGKDYDFSTLQGKVVLIVNTASACGTPDVGFFLLISVQVLLLNMKVYKSSTKLMVTRDL